MEYSLGECEMARGHAEAAMAAWGRVPDQAPEAPIAALSRGRAAMGAGRYGLAETCLDRALRMGGDPANLARPLLAHLHWITGRHDEYRSFLRRELDHARDPVETLRLLWALDHEPHPIEGVRRELDNAARMAPDDDRVRLALADLAIRSGQVALAGDLLKRCERAHPGDTAVWRARLEWAQAAGEPDEVMARQDKSPLPACPEDGYWRSGPGWPRGAVIVEPSARPLKRSSPCSRTSPAPSSSSLTWLRRMARSSDSPSSDAARRRATRHAIATRRCSTRSIRRSTQPSSPATRRRWADHSTPAPGGLWRSAGIKPPGPRPRSRWLAWQRPGPRPSLVAGRSPTSSGRSCPVSAKTAVPAAVSVPTFTDDAERSGLAFTFDSGRSDRRQLPETMSGGVALLDFNGDGWLDVYAVQGGPFPPPTAPLYPSVIASSATAVTDGSRTPPPRPACPRCPAVTGTGSPSATTTMTVALICSSPDGGPMPSTTTAATGASKTSRRVRGSAATATGQPRRRGPTWTTTATSISMCAITCNGTRQPPPPAIAGIAPTIPTAARAFSSLLPDHVFRNDRGRFVDVTAEAGIVDRDGRGLGVVAADLDDDGKTDLFVANDQSANYFFRNRGGFHFVEEGVAAGLAGNAHGGYLAGMGVAYGDFDGDGRLDLAVTNFLGESTTLYHNHGGGLFSDRAAAAGLAAPTRFVLGFGLTALDANNDGHLDLAQANGHVEDRRPTNPYADARAALSG